MMNIAIAGTALLVAAAASAAEPQRPVPIARWDATVSEGRARQIDRLHDFGGCLVQYRRFIAEDLLAAEPGSDAEGAVLPRLVQDGFCIMTGQLRLRHHRLRGILAEGFFHRGAMHGPLRAPRPGEESWEAFRAASADRSDMLRARWVALCTVRSAPDGVRDLLETPTASPRELQRLLALSDAITRCGAGGPPLPVDRSDMRNLLADALYRLTR